MLRAYGWLAWEEKREVVWTRCRWMENVHDDRRRVRGKEFVVSHTPGWGRLWGIPVKPSTEKARSLARWLSLNRAYCRPHEICSRPIRPRWHFLLFAMPRISSPARGSWGRQSVRDMKRRHGQPGRRTRPRGFQTVCHRAAMLPSGQIPGMTTTTRIAESDICS